MSRIKFTGIMPALITPLDKNGHVNKKAVKELMDDNYAAGVKGFYVTGGTGEGPVLSAAQRMEMTDAAIEANAGRGQIIIHTGSINCEESMELTRYATKAGADGISSVPPSFYFKFNLAETVDYYKEMADNTDKPVLVYASLQSGSAVDVNVMMAELLKIDNICGAKDTRGNYFAMWALKHLNGGDINVINGPDEMLLCGLSVGADGGIGSTYSIMPGLFVEMYNKFKAGDIVGAQAVQEKLNKLIGVFIRWADGDIIRSVKAALTLNGFEAGKAVAPARDYTPEQYAKLKAELEAAGYVFRK